MRLHNGPSARREVDLKLHGHRAHTGCDRRFEAAVAAVSLAADIAALYESRLVVLHVSHREEGAGPSRHVLEEAKRICDEHGVKDVAIDLVEGDPAEQILHRAEQEEVELIVVGRRGLGHLEGLLAGERLQQGLPSGQVHRSLGPLVSSLLPEIRLAAECQNPGTCCVAQLEGRGEINAIGD